MRKCKGCGRYPGACICSELAAKHRAAQERTKAKVTVCGRRFASGGTCHATAPCGRDHSRY